MIKKSVWLLVFVLALALTVLPIQALAATTLTSPYTNLSASVDGSNVTDSSASTGTASMTVTGGTYLAKNGTLTLTNSGSEAARLSFSYSVSSSEYNSFTVAGSTGSASGGSYNAELASGASIAIYLECPRKTAVTVTLTNIKLEVASSANVTISHNSLGTVSVGGTAVSSGNTISVDAAGATFAASPVSGATFVGWINTEDNSVVSTAASFTYVPTGDASVTAIFTTASSEAWFFTAGKSYLVEGLGAAITSASSASNKTIILAASGTLSSGDYTIPSGVTLLLPFDSDGTCYTTSPGYDEDNYYTPSAYSTLTMADGAKITVASGGAISVSAKVSAKMGYAGAPISKYGHIAMNSDSSITVNSGGNLYAWGYITGSGTVNLKSGATAYESFQVVDWRGGTASSGMLGNSNKVFLMSQYYVQNVEAPMVIESGAVVNCSMIADVVSVRAVTVKFLGTSGCIFNLTSGSVSKWYDGSTDRLVLDINGEFSISQTEIELVQYLYSIDLADYVLPINNNVVLNVNSGATLAIEQDTSLLPGVQMNVAEGGTVKLNEGKRLFVYDEDEWKSGYYVYSSAYFRPVRYAHGRTYTRTNADIIDAKVQVNGTLDASAGYLYTTTGGANICSTGNGVVKTQAAESSPTLYEATQSGTSISYESISIGAAQLKHGDGTYLTTAAGTYNYDAEHGKWVLGDHIVTDTVTDSTCTEGGFTTHTCACGYSYTDSETDALGHSYGEPTYSWAEDYASCTVSITCDVCADGTEGKTLTAIDSDMEPTTTSGTCQTEATTTYTVSVTLNGTTYTKSETVVGSKDTSNHTNVVTDDAVEATCTETGLTEGSHCSVCNEVIVAQEEVAALGHSHEAVVTAPTCTAAGYTTYTCSCGDTYTADEVAALGHTEVVDAAVAATCTTTGLTEGKHCSVCNEVLVAQTEVAALGHSYEAVVTAPTCTAAGYTTYTCSCGDTYTADETAALGHSYNDGVVTTAPTCTAAGVKTFTCGTCGDSYTEEVAATGHSHEAVVTAPTCTAAGYTTYTCSTCGESYTADETAALGHTEVVDAAVAATCTTTGLTEGKHCSVCNEVLVAQTEVAALGHTEVVDAAVAATCTTTGLTEGKYCSVCNEVLVAQTEVAALGHSYNDGVVTTAPTCTAAGVKTFTCGTCGDTYTEAVEATGHTEETIPAVDATCTTAGATAGVKCSVCGEVLTAPTEVPATGIHSYENGVCSVCGAEKVQESTLHTSKVLYQIGLLEPWSLRINIRLTDENSNTIDYSNIDNFGAYIIRRSDLNDPDKAIESLTFEDIQEGTHIVDGVYIRDNTYLTLEYGIEIYTYDMNDSIIGYFYFEKDGTAYHTEIRERSVLDLLNERKDSTSTTYSEYEKAVYHAMVQLNKDIVVYRAGFDTLSDPTVIAPISLAESTLGEYSENSLYESKLVQQIKLIEPWGMRLNARVFNKGDTTTNAHLDYSQLADYGIIVYHDKEKTANYTSVEDLLTHPNKDEVYVYSKSNGRAYVSGDYNQYFTAEFDHEVYTWQLDSDLYFAFYIVVDGNYHYVNFRCTNIKELAATRAVSTSSTYKEAEKLVYSDMVVLYDKVKAYRDWYFANQT